MAEFELTQDEYEKIGKKLSIIIVNRETYASWRHALGSFLFL